MTAITLSPPRSAPPKSIGGWAAFGTALISGLRRAAADLLSGLYPGLAARWIAIGRHLRDLERVNDPLFGYITDSTRSKRGRRIP